MSTTLRQTLRRLRRERAFTLTALFTLALCVAANVAIFAVVDAVLLRPLPFREPDRLVTTVNSYPKAGAPRASSSLANYYDRRTGIDAFASTAAIRRSSAIVGAAGSPDRVDAERVSPEFFSTLGVAPAAGRFFTEEEMELAQSATVMLTDSYWRTHFHADPTIVGQTMRIDGNPATIVGLLPPGFRYLSSKAQIFLPLASKPEDRIAKERHSNNLQIVARLKPGVTLAQAQAQIDAFNLKLMAEDPYAELIKGAGYHTIVAPLHADHVEDVRPMLLLLQSAVLFLLVIGAVNLVNLLLIRASARAKEFAVRQALGAGRGHVVREVLAETTLIAFVGSGLGLTLGAAGIRLVSALGADRLPLGAEVALDARVALATLALSVVIGLALAVPVLWLNLRGHLAPVLQKE
jgi:predicted permease